MLTLCALSVPHFPVFSAPVRKANAFARDSISSTGESGLKVAAHKALTRVAAKPSAPSSHATEISTLAGSSSTKNAFAKFRAMVSISKLDNTIQFVSKCH